MNKDTQEFTKQEMMDERIGRFITQQMNKQEEEAFLEEVKCNEELRVRAFATVTMAQAMQQEQMKHDEAIIKSIHHKAHTVSIRWITGIAALFAAIASYCGYGEYKYQQRNSIVEEYITIYIGSQARGSQDASIEKRLQAIAQDIKEKRDMGLVIPQLEQMYQTKEFGITYLQHNNEIAWYLSLAYIKDGQTDKAIAILKKIAHDNEGLPIAEKAQLLIERIK